VLDFGSGFGAMYQWLKQQGRKTDYFGYDISAEMIAKGKELCGNNTCEFSNSLPDKEFDYVVASGIFNVKLDTPDEDWLKYIIETLEVIHAKSKKGFAFNLLTSYSDKPFMKENLYYGDPLLFFDYCKTRFSKYVSLVHDYPLYEFTILVRKEPA
jgi:SAM-dependent methyltransferase